jgi:hypothetical protein
METCIVCGALGATVEVPASYDDDGFGIPVTIKNAVLRRHCDACGMDSVEIPDSERLEAAIAVARIMEPVALSGAEIRFLRKACGKNGKEFAAELGVDNAVLSRWENGAARNGEGHGEVSDRNIREVVWGLLFDRAPAFQVPPAYFRRMRIRRLAEGETMPRLVLERVRLKDVAHGTKSDEWDILAQAA